MVRTFKSAASICVDAIVTGCGAPSDADLLRHLRTHQRDFAEMTLLLERTPSLRSISRENLDSMVPGAPDLARWRHALVSAGVLNASFLPYARDEAAGWCFRYGRYDLGSSQLEYGFCRPLKPLLGFALRRGTWVRSDDPSRYGVLEYLDAGDGWLIYREDLP